MFRVEYSVSSDTYRVEDEHGNIAQAKITAYTAALELVEVLNANPDLLNLGLKRGKVSFLEWSRNSVQRGPTTVQRPMKCKPPGLTWERPSRKYASNRKDISGLIIVQKERKQ